MPVSLWPRFGSQMDQSLATQYIIDSITIIFPCIDQCIDDLYDRFIDIVIFHTFVIDVINVNKMDVMLI